MPDYTLYGFANTASTSTHWLLIELAAASGVTYDFVDVNFTTRAQRDATYLALNPRGRVPTLIVDGHTPVPESKACVLVLAERHPAARFEPARDSPLRARFLETLVFVANTLLPAFRDWFYAEKDQTDGIVAHGIRLLALQRIKGVFEQLDAQVKEGGYLVSTADEGPTAVDFLFAATLSWDAFVDRLAGTYPNLQTYKSLMRSRPSWKVLNDKEGIESELADGIKPWEEQYLDF